MNAIPERLRVTLDGLREALGVPLPDLEDEHERWGIYQLALVREDTVEQLRQCVRLEPVEQIAVGIVFELLENESIDDLEDWMSGMSPWAAQLVRERAHDVEILIRCASGDVHVEVDEASHWSDWLQRRLALESRSQEVLQLLANVGRTRRVRNQARSRLEGLLR